ncbi:hypothetical protein EMMF5_000966 [Cystobasidiomycetes sp. EMM_F5]
MTAHENTHLCIVVKDECFYLRKRSRFSRQTQDISLKYSVFTRHWSYHKDQLVISNISTRFQLMKPESTVDVNTGQLSCKSKPDESDRKFKYTHNLLSIQPDVRGHVYLDGYSIIEKSGFFVLVQSDGLRTFSERPVLAERTYIPGKYKLAVNPHNKSILQRVDIRIDTAKDSPTNGCLAAKVNAKALPRLGRSLSGLLSSRGRELTESAPLLAIIETSDEGPRQQGSDKLPTRTDQRRRRYRTTATK